MQYSGCYKMIKKQPDFKVWWFVCSIFLAANINLFSITFCFFQKSWKYRIFEENGKVERSKKEDGKFSTYNLISEFQAGRTLYVTE